MSVWSEATALAKRAAADLTAVVNRILFLENITIHSALDVNTDYENKDPITGRFKTITHKRVDGTVIRRTTYEIDPDEPAEAIHNLEHVHSERYPEGHTQRRCTAS